MYSYTMSNNQEPQTPCNEPLDSNETIPLLADDVGGDLPQPVTSAAPSKKKKSKKRNKKKGQGDNNENEAIQENAGQSQGPCPSMSAVVEE